MRGFAKVKTVACLAVHADSSLKFRKRLSQRQYLHRKGGGKRVGIKTDKSNDMALSYRPCSFSTRFDITHSLLKGQSLQHAITILLYSEY